MQNEKTFALIRTAAVSRIEALGLNVASMPRDCTQRVNALYFLSTLGPDCGRIDREVRVFASLAGLDLAELFESAGLERNTVADSCIGDPHDPLDGATVLEWVEYPTLGGAVRAFSMAAGCNGAFAPGHLFALAGQIECGDYDIDAAIAAAESRSDADHGDYPYNGPARFEVGGTSNALHYVFGSGRSFAVLELELDEDGNDVRWNVGVGARGSDDHVSRHDSEARWSLLDSVAKRARARDGRDYERAAS